MIDHFGLDFNLIENFAVVDSDNGSNHLWNNYNITQVGLDDCRLLTDLSGHCLFGLAQAFKEVFLSSLGAAVEVTTLTATQKLDQVFRLHFKKLVQIDTTEGVLFEGTLLLDFHAVRHFELFIRVSVRQSKSDSSHF